MLGVLFLAITLGVLLVETEAWTAGGLVTTEPSRASEVADKEPDARATSLVDSWNEDLVSGLQSLLFRKRMGRYAPPVPVSGMDPLTAEGKLRQLRQSDRAVGRTIHRVDTTIRDMRINIQRMRNPSIR